MVRVDPTSAVLAMLIGGSLQCAPSSEVLRRYTATVPTAKIQGRVDECVLTQDHACFEICRELFDNVPGRLLSCERHEVGSATDVTAVAKIPVDAGADHDDSPPPQSCAGGRRPQGLAMARVAGSTAAAYLAGCAQLEAASIVAFARVHADLVALAAPSSLMARVREAAAQELVHARIVIALARRYGANVVAPGFEAIGERVLVERAIENVIEGCVGEVAGAIDAALIAAGAEDPVVRAAFMRIAVDETAHARLAYELAAVYAGSLTGQERVRVGEAFEIAARVESARGVAAGLMSLGVARSAPRQELVARALAALGSGIARV